MAEDSGTTTTFGSDMARLKEIVSILERNEVGLEEGVSLYKEARACVERCRGKLADARNVLERDGLVQDADDFLAEGGQNAGGAEGGF